MSRDLLDLVRELNTLNDDNLADRVIANSDVQWCLSELQDILEEMPTLTPQNEWVSVEERLPEQENTQVLMTDGECHYISSRNNMVRFLDCEGIFIPGKAGAGVKVTHWMPLPERPKEE